MTKKKRQGPPAKGGQIWDALNGVSASVGALTNITAVLIPYLQDKTLLEKITDRNRFNLLATTLDADLRACTNELAAIRAMHQDKRGTSEDPNDWMQAINIQEQYVQWATQFDDVVIPVFTDMLEMIQAAGGQTNTVSIPTARQSLGNLS